MISTICPVKSASCKSNTHFTAITVAETMTDVQVYTKVADIPFQDWNSLISVHDNFYFTLPYLSAIEACNRHDTDFRYVLVKQNNQPVLLAYCQVMEFDVRKTQKYTPDIAAKDWKESVSNFFSKQLKNIVANIKIKLLVCGNLFLSGEFGFCYHPSFSEKQAHQLLTETLESIAKKEKNYITGVLIKDFFVDKGHDLATFELANYHPFQGDPIMYLHIPKEWNSFDDYLNALSSKYRQRAKSALKKSQSLTAKALSLEYIEENKAEMYHLFESVVKKSSFNLKETPQDYMCCLRQYLPERVKVTGYFEGDKLIGFMSIIRAGNHLEAHFLGYEDDNNHKYKLYQRMLYDMIAIGVNEKFEKISFGRTAIEIKTTVGAVPHPANMYLRLRNRIVNRIGGPIIRNIPTDPYTQRHPFKGQEDADTAHSEEEKIGV